MISKFASAVAIASSIQEAQAWSFTSQFLEVTDDGSVTSNSPNSCEKLNPWLKPENIDTNEQPVIGIVSQTLDFTPDKDDHRFDDYKSYIMAAYVRFVQGAGARVIPFIYDEPEDVTIEKLGKVNGVLFPGGGGDYIKIGELIVKHAK